MHEVLDSAEVTVRKFSEWFPEWHWKASDVGAFKCIWASETREGQLGEFTVVGEFVERVARCRTWRAALVKAKEWAWKQRRAQRAKKEGSDDV